MEIMDKNLSVSKIFRARGFKFLPDEIQALLKASLDFGVEDIRRSGGSIDHLFYNVQQQMTKYGDFHERKLYVLKQYYLKAMREFISGKFDPYPPEARQLWGTDEHNIGAEKNDKAWAGLIRFMIEHKKAITRVSKQEIQELIKEAAVRRIEFISYEEEIAAFREILTIMHAKKLFRKKGVQNLRQTYQRLRMRYRKGNTDDIPPEAGILWGGLAKADYSHVSDHSSNKEPVQKPNNASCRICRECLLNDAKDLFTDTYQGQTYREIIHETIFIRISLDGQLGTKICQLCSQFVEKLAHFAQQCRESFTVFLGIVEAAKSSEMIETVDFSNEEIDFSKEQNDVDRGETGVSDLDNALLYLIGNEEPNIQDTEMISIEEQTHRSPGKTRTPRGRARKNKNGSGDATKASEAERNYRKFIESRPERAKTNTKRQCHVCGKKFLDLSTHLARHTQKTVECDICHKKYSNHVQLQIHRNFHTKEQEYKCHHCDKVFYAWRSRRWHQELHHMEGEKKKFSCDKCDAVYTNKQHLEAHVKQKHLGIRNLPCSQCDFSTFNRHRLLNHVRSIHTSERPYQCSVCDNTSNSSTGYYIHFKRHKKSGEATQYTIKCAYCAQLFKTDATFEAHVREQHPDKAVEV